MIAEFFYGAELKQNIMRLKAQNDLNTTSLETLNYQIYMRIFFFILISTLLFIVVSNPVMWVVVIFLFLGIWWDIKSYYQSYMVPYIYGERKKARVLNVVAMGHFYVKIICVFQENVKITIGPLREFRKLKNLHQEGEEIFFYQGSNEKNRAMPDFVFIKNKYCLSKAILDRD